MAPLSFLMAAGTFATERSMSCPSTSWIRMSTPVTVTAPIHSGRSPNACLKSFAHRACTMMCTVNESGVAEDVTTDATLACTPSAWLRSEANTTCNIFGSSALGCTSLQNRSAAMLSAMPTSSAPTSSASDLMALPKSTLPWAPRSTPRGPSAAKSSQCNAPPLSTFESGAGKSTGNKSPRALPRGDEAGTSDTNCNSRSNSGNKACVESSWTIRHTATPASTTSNHQDNGARTCVVCMVETALLVWWRRQRRNAAAGSQRSRWHRVRLDATNARLYAPAAEVLPPSGRHEIGATLEPALLAQSGAEGDGAA
mmetsp:Transcript_41010/g.112829  ORF Transcript_41010/g.112829 Transcript_41010/m.112829 type:complete len:312 (+) Transcript_41010:1847-2782(+)